VQRQHCCLALQAKTKHLLELNVVAECLTQIRMKMALLIAMMHARWMQTRLTQVFVDVESLTKTLMAMALWIVSTFAQPTIGNQFKVLALALLGLTLLGRGLHSPLCLVDMLLPMASMIVCRITSSAEAAPIQLTTPMRGGMLISGPNTRSSPCVSLVTVTVAMKV
jgi:hypothetical protein